jgi:hypothetical protein
MTDKRVTPYQRLLAAARSYVSRVEHPTRKALWTCPKDKLAESWRLDNLFERVAAADLLGYDTRLNRRRAARRVREAPGGD